MRQLTLLTRTFESSEWRVEGSICEYRTIAGKMSKKLEHKSCM